VPITSDLGAGEAAAIAALVALVPAAASAIYALKQSRAAKRSAEAAERQVVHARTAAKAAEASVSVATAQLGSSRDVALGQLLLTFDELLLQFTDIHQALHPRAHDMWTLANPPSAEEQVRLELYMGLFERMWLLADRHIVPIEIAQRLWRDPLRSVRSP